MCTRQQYEGTQIKPKNSHFTLITTVSAEVSQYFCGIAASICSSSPLVQKNKCNDHVYFIAQYTLKNKTVAVYIIILYIYHVITANTFSACKYFCFV
jgi:hypothetical protein